MECVFLTETDRCRRGVPYDEVTAIRDGRLIMPCMEDEGAPHCTLARFVERQPA